MCVNTYIHKVMIYKHAFYIVTQYLYTYHLHMDNNLEESAEFGTMSDFWRSHWKSNLLVWVWLFTSLPIALWWALHILYE